MLKNFWRTNPLAQKITQVQRNRLKKTATKANRVKLAKPKQERVIDLSNLKIFIVIGIVLIVFFFLVIPGISLFVNYSKFQPQQLTDNFSLNGQDTPIENHAFFLLSEDSDPEKRFVDNIVLLSVNRQQQLATVVEVEPQFVSLNRYLQGRELNQQVLYNNALAMQKDPNPAMNEGLKSLLAIGVNNYTVMDHKDFKKVMKLCAQGDDRKLSNFLHGFKTAQLLACANNLGNFPKISTTLNREKFISMWSDLANSKRANIVKIDTRFGTKGDFKFGEGLDPDEREVDRAISQIMTTNDVIAEQVRVEVFNASGRSGLAARISRLLGNYGINVIRFSNAPKVEEKTSIYAAERYDAQSNIKLVTSLIDPKISVKKEAYGFNTTGDIVIVLGSDQADR